MGRPCSFRRRHDQPGKWGGPMTKRLLLLLSLVLTLGAPVLATEDSRLRKDGATATREPAKMSFDDITVKTMKVSPTGSAGSGVIGRRWKSGLIYSKRL